MSNSTSAQRRIHRVRALADELAALSTNEIKLILATGIMELEDRESREAALSFCNASLSSGYRRP